MSKRPWFPLYVGDLLADTMNFDPAQFGGYLKILCHYWMTEEPMTRDEMRAASGLSKNIFEKSWHLFEKKFVVENEKYFNRRMKEEITKATEISDKRAKAGSKGGQANAQANEKLLPTQLQSQLHKEHSVNKLTEQSSETPQEKPPTFWDVGKGLGIPGSVIGKQCKTHSETAIAKAIAATQIKNPADPTSFFLGLLKANPTKGAQEEWERIPYDNDQLVAWAKDNDFSAPPEGWSWEQYRARLRSEIELRRQQAEAA